MNPKLYPPLTNIYITQGFGENKVNFYQQLGMIGHNGIDFMCDIGTPLYACHGGTVLFAGMDGDGGISITLVNSPKGDSFKTIYYHLSSVIVKRGDVVKPGQLIGYTGNTGKYTTGPHLHLGLKLCKDTVTLNNGNGYFGAINPIGYFVDSWRTSRANNFYERTRNWLAEYYLRFAPISIKNRWTEGGRYIHSVLKRIGFSSPFLSGEQVNAIIYGSWDLESVLSEDKAMFWRWFKKDEWDKF